MLEKVLKISKSLDDEKVGVSFQMPKGLKEEVDHLCDKNGIKLTTFFNSLAQVAIEESKGNYESREIMFQRLANQRIALLSELIANLESLPDYALDEKRLSEIQDSKIEINQLRSELKR